MATYPLPRRRRRATTVTALSVLSALSAAALVGCSTEDGGATAATQSAEQLTVVASTSVWGDVAEAVLGDDAEVSAIVEDSSIDPHSFEPSAADIARAMDADFTVVNGGGYDAWIYEPLGDAATIIHPLPLISHAEAHNHGDEGHDHDHGEHHHDHDHGDHDHDHDHGDHDHAHGEHEHADHDHSTELTAADGTELTTVDGNEHIWFDVDAVTLVAEDIVAHARELNPDTTADASGVVQEMDALRERLAALGEATVAQTETIGDYLIDDSALTDITPAPYRQAALNHADPAASDLAEFLEVIDSGELDVLLYNPQTATDLTARIREAAEAAGLQIVEIGEVPPEGTDFLDYFHQVVDDLEQAVEAA